jgi:hypothetical protein
MSTVEHVVVVLTSIAIVTLIFTYPRVPVAAAKSIANAIAGVISLAKPH